MTQRTSVWLSENYTALMLRLFYQRIGLDTAPIDKMLTPLPRESRRVRRYDRVTDRTRKESK